MRSIIYDLQFDNFPRLRLGIGKERKEDMVNFVMSGFAADEKKRIQEAIDNSVAALTAWLDKGIDMAMGEYNTKKEPKQKKLQEEVKDDRQVSEDKEHN